MKKILAFCLSIAFVFGAFCMPVSASPVIEEGISVYINDDVLASEQGAITLDGSTMIPLRAATEALGCEVLWNESDMSITITRDDLYLVMFINDFSVYGKMGETFKLAAAPIMFNDTTMVPLRFLSDMLGKQIIWDEITRTVFVDSEKTYNELLKTHEYKYLANVKPSIDKATAYVENGLLYEARDELSYIDNALLTEFELNFVNSLRNSVNDKIAVLTERANKKTEYLNRAASISAQDMSENEMRSTIGMKQYAGRIYTQWDDLLNDIYGYLKQILPVNEFNALEKDEVAWISRRDGNAEVAAEGMKGGTGEGLLYTETLMNDTEDRCYYLISLIK
ncbi:MAG: stalk domain-containing protein [Oscillospiraceae bacterium]